MLCVICCDVQYDFLPGGTMEISGSDQILIPLVGVAAPAHLRIASRDWHPENHFSFSENPTWEDGSWPPHCIQKTKGAKIHPSINKYTDFVISKGMHRNPPDMYSAFAGKTLRPVETIQDILGRYPIETIVVGGLPLDICVKYTALDANALGYRTIVPLDCTRSWNDSEPIIQGLRRAGVIVVNSFDEITDL